LKPIDRARLAGVLTALALAVPASAAAQPTVYEVEAKTGNAGVTFLTDPSGSGLTNVETRYTVSNGGYVGGFAETNGVSGGGVLDYSVLPTEYRAPMTADEKRTYTGAQTDVQAHATCSGVAELASGANILAWQSADADPAYDYIPWQKTSAGLGDVPSKWIAVVKTATGVDLSTLSTVSDFTTACTTLSGTYHAADTPSALATGLIAAAVAPLEKQVADLKKAKETSDKATKTATDARKAAEAAYSATFERPLVITLAAKRFTPQDGVTVLITGSVNDPVTVTLELTKKQKSKLGVSSRLLVETTKTISSQGAVLLTLKPDRDDAKQLSKHKGSIPVKVKAVSSALSDSAAAKFVH
jgi:hypothetical protein